MIWLLWMQNLNPPPPFVRQMPSTTNTSVGTVIFWDLLNWVLDWGTDLIGYQRACPTNTPVRTGFSEDFMFAGHVGGGTSNASRRSPPPPPPPPPFSRPTASPPFRLPGTKAVPMWRFSHYFGKSVLEPGVAQDGHCARGGLSHLHGSVSPLHIIHTTGVSWGIQSH